MLADYAIKRAGKPREAEVFLGGERVARIQEGEGPVCHLTSREGVRWCLDPRVHGEIRRFSMTVTGVSSAERQEAEPAVLVIREHLFAHEGSFYVLGGTPEGMHPAQVLIGKKYICRLDNFPFAGLADIDHETRNRLRRLRGVPVGEIDGLGTESHHVRLFADLADIGLPLSASSYLLYSTG